MEPRIDAAGNIFGRRAGKENSLPPVLFGSHIDSVPKGGNFDGDLGSLGAIEVVRTLREAGVTTRRPLEVVVWSCEEASFAGHALNGSRAVVGEVPASEWEVVSNGLNKREAVKKIGGNPERLEEAQLKRGAFHAYVELHIEQGGTLERRGIPVGVVDGIVSVDDYEVVVKGVANHAGTTPMADRQDALVAASRLTLAVREVVTGEPGAQVGTVGHLEVVPNAANVVPGEARMSVEVRDLSAEKVRRLGKKIEERAQAIAAEMRVEIGMKQVLHLEGAGASSGLQKEIEAAASGLGLGYVHLPSGAGHDAQMMARVGEMAMIFVPSVKGISHSPREFTAWEDCRNGVEVLLGTVQRLGNS